MNHSFALNSPSVVAEVIDDEAVIMNLRSGQYFSSRGSGRLLWEWVSAGHSICDIRESLAEHFAGDRDVMSADADRFIEELLRHELIVRTNASEATAIGRPDRRVAYTPPILESFTDMQDLLLLDPIHDVDEGGWPMPKSHAATKADAALHNDTR